MSELRLSGLIASPGMALGPVLRLGSGPARGATPHSPDGADAARTCGAPTLGQAASDPATEKARLRAAMQHAATELEALMAPLAGEEKDILAFQLALLHDDALSETADEAIAAGIRAAEAWRQGMAREIAAFTATDDPAFAARAADLRDLRDRVARHLTPALDEVTAVSQPIPTGAVIVAEDLLPSQLLALPPRCVAAIALETGSTAAHVATLARSRGLPMLVGLGPMPAAERAIIDAQAGMAVLDPSAASEHHFRAAVARPLAEAGAGTGATADWRTPLPAAFTATGSPVAVLLNVSDPAELDGLDPAIADGIGLVRTEFLFPAAAGLPDEEVQFRAYAALLSWASGRPVTIRTLDAGGDKPIDGLTVSESNPFLGLRGLRLSLLRPEVFRVQLRALARATAGGTLRVMLPMVTLPEEFEAAEALLEEEVAKLRAEGVPCDRPPLGMMVEVPAAALTAEAFDAAFYSIGSNDLTQYTLAASRGSAGFPHLHDQTHPAVLELIGRTVSAASRRGVDVSLCGDAAADPALVPRLLATGLRTLSVPAPAVNRVKEVIGTSRPPEPPSTRTHPPEHP